MLFLMKTLHFKKTVVLEIPLRVSGNFRSTMFFSYTQIVLFLTNIETDNILLRALRSSVLLLRPSKWQDIPISKQSSNDRLSAVR